MCFASQVDVPNSLHDMGVDMAGSTIMPVIISSLEFSQSLKMVSISKEIGTATMQFQLIALLK